MGHLRPEFDSLARVWSKGSYFGGLIPRRLPVFVFGEFLRRHIENGASEVVPIYDTKKAVIQRSPGTVPGKWARNCCSRAVSCSIPGKLMPVESGSLDPITAVNSNQNHQPSAKAQSGSANAATSPVLGVALLKL